MIGKLRIDCGWKGFTASVLLEASCTVMSDVTLKGGNLLTQNCTSGTVELGLKFNVGRLCVDVKLKGTASYLDDIKMLALS